MSRRRPVKHHDKPPEETKAAEAVTVFWMLTLMCTLVSFGIAIALGVAGALAGGADRQPSPIDAAPALLFFISLVCGALCIGLTLAAGRVRKSKPPAGITFFALIAGAAPWVALLVLLAMQWS